MRINTDLFKQRWLPIALGAAITVLFLLHARGYMQLRFIERLEQIAYDFRLNRTLQGGVDKRIVIVDVDEQTLLTEGRWPWPRTKIAHMMDRLFDHYGVAVVGFDMVFAEADENVSVRDIRKLAIQQGETQVVRALDRWRVTLDRDRLFADSLRSRPVVLGYYFDSSGSAKSIKSGQLPEPLFRVDQYTGRRIEAPRAVGYGANLPVLQRDARAAGHFDNPLVDADGLFRRVPLLQQYDDGLYESLSLAVARLYLGAEVGLMFAAGAPDSYPPMEWVMLGERRIPVDHQAAVLVPYRGRQGSFPYVSAADILNDKVPDPAVLKDAIVLVGTTAAGLLDLRATPVQSIYPGVEIHANIIAGILDQSFLHRPAYIIGANFLLVLVTGFLLTVFLPIMKPLWTLVASSVVMLFLVGLNAHVWTNARLVLPFAPAALLVLALFVLNMSYGFFVESRGKWALGKLFGQYVPPELVEEMNKQPEDYTLEGDKREMTVLFSDIRGFTPIAEGLDPKQLSELMNEYLTPMTQVIHGQRGTIDKYMGDAIMAFWGAPLANPDHARDALIAALEMQRAAEQLRDRFIARGWPPVHIGIGLNTGEMVVGNMGSEFRMAYTVLGDAVNLASRLEGLTKVYSARIIVSDTVRHAARGFVFRELDRVRVKGKQEPVTIYEPLGSQDVLTSDLKDELSLHNQTLALYRRGQWDQAELQFLNLRDRSSATRLYEIYIERIQHFRQHPPATDWDGVFQAYQSLEEQKKPAPGKTGAPANDEGV